MKCPNCGAEINNTSKFCEYCGSSVTMQMLHEQEQLNKAGCPRCSSTNISFSREKQGELKGRHGTAIVRSTVGFCRDCGYTWQSDAEKSVKKKRKTWLWVLGWLFLFPVPITILMLRKKDMKPALKYGIIAAAWIIFLAIGLSNPSESSEATQSASSTEATASTEAVTEPSTILVTEGEPEPATEEPIEQSSSDDNDDSSAAFQLVLDLIKTTGTENFDYYTVEGDVSCVTINTAGEGISKEILLAKASGNDENYEPWVEMKDSMLSYGNSIHELLNTLGYEDTQVIINVLNDENHENVLLTLLNDTVFYDCMAE